MDAARQIKISQRPCVVRFKLFRLNHIVVESFESKFLAWMLRKGVVKDRFILLLRSVWRTGRSADWLKTWCIVFGVVYSFSFLLLSPHPSVYYPWKLPFQQRSYNQKRSLALLIKTCYCKRPARHTCSNEAGWTSLILFMNRICPSSR